MEDARALFFDYFVFNLSTEDWNDFVDFVSHLVIFPLYGDLDSLIWPWRIRRQISAFTMVRKAKYLCLTSFDKRLLFLFIRKYAIY